MKLPVLAIEAMASKAPKGIVVPIPSGFKPPQGKGDGEEFEILVKAHAEGPNLVFHSADGFDLNADEPLEEPEQAEETAEETEGEKPSGDESTDKDVGASKQTGEEDEDDEMGLMKAIDSYRNNKIKLK